MTDELFFDTNVLLYAFVQDDPRRAIADPLVAAGGVISVQSLNELIAVARRKLKLPWGEILPALEGIRARFPSPEPVTLETHRLALAITRKYGFYIFDCLLLASAIESGCTVFYSEDMQDGQVIEGLRIRNPFLQ